jgi:hypothetical protein
MSLCARDRPSPRRDSAFSSDSIANKVAEPITKPEPLQQETSPARRKRRRHAGSHAPQFDLATDLRRISGVDLTRVDGIDVTAVQTLVSEWAWT